MKTEPIPLRIGIGSSTSKYAPVSIGIRYLTREPMNPFGEWSKYSHNFLAFGMSDNNTLIHEALGSSGWREKTYEDLMKWHNKSPENHPFEILWLPITTIKVGEIFTESKSWLGTRSYSFRQVAAFAFAKSMLFRKMKIQILADDEEVMCSEGASQLIGTHCPEWDLRKQKDRPYCLLTPQEVYDEAIKRLALFSTLPCWNT